MLVLTRNAKTVAANVSLRRLLTGALWMLFLGPILLFNPVLFAQTSTYNFTRAITFPVADSLVSPYLCTVDSSGNLWVASSQATPTGDDSTALNALFEAAPGDSQLHLVLTFADSDSVREITGLTSTGDDIFVISRVYNAAGPLTYPYSQMIYLPDGNPARRVRFRNPWGDYGTWYSGLAGTRDGYLYFGQSYLMTIGTIWGQTEDSLHFGSTTGFAHIDFSTPMEPGGAFTSPYYTDLIRSIAVYPDSDYGDVVMNQGTLPTVWQASDTTKNLPTWFDTNNMERNTAYGNVGGKTHLYIPYAGTTLLPILVIDATTGDSVGTLDTAGISGGTFPLEGIGVSKDGLIFASNLTVNAQTSPFKVYEWTSDSAKPTAVISYADSVYRLGDHITVTGSASDNSLTIWAAAMGKKAVVKFTTTDNGASFRPTVIRLNDAANIGSTPKVYPLSNGDFFVSSAGVGIKEYDATGNLIGAVTPTSTSIGSMAYLSGGSPEHAYIIEYDYTEEIARVLDVTNGIANADSIAATPTLGTAANLNGTGDIAVESNANNSFTLFVLGTNNGLAAYTFGSHPSDTSVVVFTSRNSAIGGSVPNGGIAAWTGGSAFNPVGYHALRVTDPSGLLTWGTDIPYGIAIQPKTGYLFACGTDSARRWVKGFQVTYAPGFGYFATSADELPSSTSKDKSTINIAGAPFVAPTDVAFNEDGSTAYVADRGSKMVYVFNSAATTPGLPKVWQYSDWTGNLPDWFNTNSELRSMAYGKVGGQHDLFVTFGATSLMSPMILSAATGDSVGILDTTGISGGTFPLDGIGASSDGLIFASNLTVNAQTSPFKVYEWASEGAKPTAVISYADSAYRLGDHITVTGSASDNSLTIWAAAMNKKAVVKFTTTDNGASFTPTVIILNNAVSTGSTPKVYPASNGDFFVSSAGVGIKEYDASGNLLGTVSFPSAWIGSMAYLYGGSPEHDYVIEYDYSHEVARVLDVTSGIGSADSVAGTSTLGTLPNLNGTGDIAYEINPDSTATIFVLGTNNGIGAYTFGANLTGVRENKPEGVPSSFVLNQNYPNPFNPTTIVSYSVPERSYVTLTVYNVLGQEVRTLFAGYEQPGNYAVTFDGSRLASGVYFCRLNAGGNSFTKKMVLMK